MTPGFWEIIRCIIIGLLLPFLSGTGILALADRRSKETDERRVSVILPFVAGYLLLWSLVELISVPGTVFKIPFRPLAGIILGIVAVMGIYGLFTILNNIKDGKGVSSGALISVFEKKSDVVLFIVFIVVAAIFLYMNITSDFYDADDSRFLVGAGDIVRSNYILKTDPVTGGLLDSGYRDFKKDLISQWAAFIAYNSVLTGMDATVYAHSVYPIFAGLLIVSVYWLLMKDQSMENKTLAGIILVVMAAFGNYSTHSQETVSIVRTWQGKATLSLFGVLCIIYIFMQIYDKGDIDPRNGLLLVMADLSLSLMSSMGIVIAAIMLVSYGLYMAVAKKKLKIFIISALICIPNVLLYLLSEVYTIERFVG